MPSLVSEDRLDAGVRRVFSGQEPRKPLGHDREERLAEVAGVLEPRQKSVKTHEKQVRIESRVVHILSGISMDIIKVQENTLEVREGIVL